MDHGESAAVSGTSEPTVAGMSGPTAAGESKPTAAGESRPTGADTSAPAAPGLSERDARVLRFERRTWRYPAAKDEAIRAEFDLSPARYYQLLNALIESPAALAAEPMLVGRLSRLRAARRHGWSPASAASTRPGPSRPAPAQAQAAATGRPHTSVPATGRPHALVPAAGEPPASVAGRPVSAIRADGSQPDELA